MLAIVKKYLKITSATKDAQLKLAIDMAISMAAMYINKPLIIEEQFQDYGKVRAEDDVYLINYPIYSLDQLRISTTFKFDTSGEYDTPTILFTDNLKGMLKLDQNYSGDFRARYKSGYDYKVFQDQTITINSVDTDITDGLYNIEDMEDFITNETTSALVYDEDTNKFKFTHTASHELIFGSDLLRKLFGFDDLTNDAAATHTSDNEVFWLPENMIAAINIITDKIHDISKMLSGNVSFRKKKIVHQDGLQTEFSLDDIPIEAKQLLDPFKRIYL